MAPVKKTRPYRSPARAEQAQRTRAAILEAARTLFLERGFAATTIAAVAERAGVAPETVYAVHRGKPGLLGAVVRDAVVRGEQPEDPLERPWVRSLLEQDGLTARLSVFARHTAETVALTGPLYGVIRSAGTGKPALAELDRTLSEARFRDQARIIAAIADGRSFPGGISVRDAADTFSTISSPELHRLLTDERGWSQERYSEWLQRTITATLAPSS